MRKLIKKSRDNGAKAFNIYIAYCECDTIKNAELLSEDLLEARDCSVFYISDSSDNEIEASTNNSFADELLEMNLFVFSITKKFFENESSQCLDDLKFAFSHKIPVLPVLMEAEAEFFIKEKNFPFSDIAEDLMKLQYLNRFSKDVTEISFKIKLRKYLDQILLKDELISRIRSAFDAYVFLSYRKKDRAEAQKIMKLIHNIPNCSDIAIWYDEFLTPGESWSDSIAEVLSNAVLMLMAITPNVYETGNYIIEHEYPMAKVKRKEIIAIEMIPTNLEILRSVFPGICDPVLPSHLKDTIQKSLQSHIITERSKDPNHNFLIGLAYLYGIDVEINREKAITIIEREGNNGLPEACRMMALIYQFGMGVSISYKHAYEWFERYISLIKQDGNDLITAVFVMEAYVEFCNLLEMHYPMSFSFKVNNEILPYIQTIAKENGYIEFLGIVYFDAKNTQEGQDFLYYLCWSYYEAVRSAMIRDADNSHAYEYADIIHTLMEYITDINRRNIIEEWFSYLNSAATFWKDFVAVANNTPSKKKVTTQKQKEYITALEKECERSAFDYLLKEELADAYCELLYMYLKTADVKNILLYFEKYISIAIECYKKNPEVLMGFDIMYCFAEIVSFCTTNKYDVLLKKALHKELDFLIYCESIGEHFEDKEEILKKLKEMDE